LNKAVTIGDRFILPQKLFTFNKIQMATFNNALLDDRQFLRCCNFITPT